MSSQTQDSTSVAIIGISGRFPGANDVWEFWRNLIEGRETITTFSRDQLLRSGLTPGQIDRNGYVPAKGIITQPEHFDAKFFGLSRAEAEALDPQQRLFLELAWHALEDAGYSADSGERGQVGVFASSGFSSYLLRSLLRNPSLAATDRGYSLMISNDKDYLASRVSYHLDLSGPSVNVQTACSSSLVAVHLACQSLLSGECDLALAGGVSISFPVEQGYQYSPGMILSPDGHCRPFDARAAGTVEASGGGTIVLKRYEDAIRDRDAIRAVIRGSAINNDGARKAGYTAPSPERQAAVIEEALSVSGVLPQDISYIEAHGTGTEIGDPIEIRALDLAFRRSSERNGVQAPSQGSCWIGSLKSNFGHLNAAAGIAGLIKAVLALQHRKLPPSLNFHTPNPIIPWAAIPFRVVTRASEWPASSDGRRFAAVSSFGIGGTNAHIILEEAQAISDFPAKGEPGVDADVPMIFPLSARSSDALESQRKLLVEKLAKSSRLPLDAVAHTLQCGRASLPFRGFAIAQDRPALLRALTSEEDSKWIRGGHPSGPVGSPAVIYLLSGQGNQYAGMASELYSSFPVFRGALDTVLTHFSPNLRERLRELLLERGRTDLLRQTEFAQPALFAVEYALAKEFTAAGIKPDLLIGHSLGEFVAAALAEIFDLPTAARLVEVRGALMQKMAPGAMLAVSSDEPIEEWLAPGLEVCVYNTRRNKVIGGTRDDIECLKERLEESGWVCSRLHTSHAFHSRFMEPLLNDFRKELEKVAIHAPKVPVLSCVTGELLSEAIAKDPHYWASQLRLPVRFDQMLETGMRLKSNSVWIEVGPGRSLISAVRQSLKANSGIATVQGMPGPADENSASQTIQSAFGEAWANGVAIDWRRLPGNPCDAGRVALPLYPFERQQYSLEHEAASQTEEKPRSEYVSTVAYSRSSDTSPTETWLAECWCELLGVTEVRSDQDFFTLGGNSLIGVQLIGRIHQRYGIRLTMPWLLRNPTAKAIVEEIDCQVSATSSGAPRSSTVEVSLARAPATAQQARLYVLDALSGESLSYHLPLAVWIDGEVDEARLQAALDSLSKRHPSLRTRFVMEDETLYQEVVSSAPIRLERGEFGGETPEAAIRKVSRRFDLATAPLFRATLFRQDDARSLLYLECHHIISDGSSQAVLLSELQSRYADLDTALEPCSSYFEYSKDQSRWLASEDARASESYWLARFEGELPRLELPSRRSRPPARDFRGGSVNGGLTADQTERLKSLARDLGATDFAAILALFFMTLSKFSGQDDLIIGTPVAGRIRPEYDRTVGLFVNTLAIRSRLRKDQSFASYLADISAEIFEALEHQRYPFDRLVESLGLQRELSRNPVFDVMLTFQNQRVAHSGKEALRVEPFEIDAQTANFDLELYVWEQKGAFRFRLEYANQVIDETLASGILSGLTTIAASALHAPDAPLASHSILRPEESEGIVRALQGPDCSPEEFDGGIQSLIEYRAEATPQSVAVISVDQSSTREWTYAELNRASNKIAWRLKAMGIEPEVKVAFLLDRDCEFLAAMLGVFKSGGAYVPLDPTSALERLVRSLEIASVRAILFEEQYRELANVLASRTSVELFSIQEALAGAGSNNSLESNPPRLGGPRSLAYVIFTSGSTGEPKGAAVEMAGMMNHLFAKARDFGFTSADRIAQNATQTFDVSVWQFLSALSVGGTTVVFKAATAWEPSLVFEAIARHGVTVFETVPSHLQLMLDEGSDSELAGITSLRWMIVNGEVLSLELCERWFRTCPGVSLANAYGPTECSDDVTHWKMSQPVKREEGSVPVGRTLDRLSIYVLDSSLMPVPEGVLGELYIGGIGVGRGYVGDAVATARAFLPDPFSRSPGARMYRTGDVGTWRNDGVVYFKGRRDSQIKLRGFRIELQEVESRILSVPGVREAVVLLTDLPEKALCAYLTVDRGIDLAAIKEKVGQYLPKYMVPDHWVRLDSFPLLSNGKIDRKALKPPVSSTEGQDFLDLQGTGKWLAGIWSEVLGIEVRRVDQSFFELGGTSLKAMRVVSRIKKGEHERKGFPQVDFTLLFKYQTIDELAAFLDRQEMSTSLNFTPSAVFGQKDSALTLPATVEHRRILRQVKANPDPTAFNMPYEAWIEGDFDEERFRTSLQALAKRHEMLGASFEGIDDREGSLSIRFRDQQDIALEEFDDSNAEDLDRARREFVRPFNLEKGPLFRAGLVRTSEGRTLLMFDNHTVAADALSKQILLRDLARIYRGETTEGSKRLTFASYLAAKRSEVETVAFERSQQFWRDRFEAAGSESQLTVPATPMVSQLLEPGARRIHLTLSETQLNRFDSESRRLKVTRASLLLTAYSAALRRVFGSERFFVLNAVADRPAAEHEHAVGLMMMHVPILCAAGDARSIHEEVLRSFSLRSAFAIECYDHWLSQSPVPPSKRRIEPVFVWNELSEAVIREEKLLALQPEPPRYLGARFDLRLEAHASPRGLELVLEYRPGLVSEEQASWLIRELKEAYAEY